MNMTKFFSVSNPLWLPRGSIRSLITIATLTLVGILVLRQIPVPDWLILWAGLIIKNYFDKREDDDDAKERRDVRLEVAEQEIV